MASCTAYLEEITSSGEIIKNIGTSIVVQSFHHIELCLDPTWRQFRFSVGAPDAEAKFKGSVNEVQADNANAKKFPTLFVPCIIFLQG